MGLFQHLEGEAAILIENGVYKQVDVYARDGYLYGKVNGGFVRLNADGSTTKAKCRLNHLDFSGPLAMDNLGRLCDPAIRKNTKALPERTQLLLTAGSD